MEKIEAEIFDLLKNGKIISINSEKRDFLKIIKFLQDEDKIFKLNQALNLIGYVIIGEDGYFYLAKESRVEDIELDRFINRHKRAFLAISILKMVFSNIPPEIRFSKFTEELLSKEDKKVFEYLEALTEIKDDYKTMTEKLFRELVTSNIIERIEEENKDRYRLLHGFNYYIKILDNLEFEEE